MNEIAKEARPEFLPGSEDAGVLVIHGFTGSTQSMRPLAYKLHEFGYTVSMPCLKGHGTTPEDMETTGYTDWVQSVKTAYEELRPRVKKLFVLGLSMGGTLTLYSAIHFKIEGAITINAAVSLPEMRAVFTDPATPRFLEGIGSDIKKKGVKEWAYDKTPKKCIGEILQLTDLVRERLSEITCPILIFKSIDDHVVPPKNQDYIFDHVGSFKKELVELSESFHVATLDNDLEMIEEETHRFINSILNDE